MGLPRGRKHRASDTAVPTCRDGEWGTAVHIHAPRAAPPGESTAHMMYGCACKSGHFTRRKSGAGQVSRMALP